MAIGVQMALLDRLETARDSVEGIQIRKERGVEGNSQYDVL